MMDDDGSVITGIRERGYEEDDTPEVAEVGDVAGEVVQNEGVADDDPGFVIGVASVNDGVFGELDGRTFQGNRVDCHITGQGKPPST